MDRTHSFDLAWRTSADGRGARFTFEAGDFYAGSEAGVS
jgi:hypothetical protein